MNVFECAKSLKKIEEFYDFCVEMHQFVGYSNGDCDISLYTESLKDAIDRKTCCSHRKMCFINQSLKYQNTFQSMFNL